MFRLTVKARTGCIFVFVIEITEKAWALYIHLSHISRSRITSFVRTSNANTHAEYEDLTPSLEYLTMKPSIIISEVAFTIAIIDEGIKVASFEMSNQA